jgi:hypothetical protein
MRKTLIIVGILLILAIVGVAGWLWWNNTQQDTSTGTSTPSGSETTPFGEPEEGGERPRQDTGQPATGDEDNEGQRQSRLQLQQLTDTAVAGATAVHGATGTPAIRYLERQTGHVYELNPNTAERTRTSNTTVPGMHDTTWRRDADALVARYASDEGEVRSFAARILDPSATSTNSDIGSFERVEYLEQGISAIAPSPTKRRAFYFHSTEDGARGVIADFTAGSKQQLLETSFSSWRVQWPAENHIALTASASLYANGSLYFVDTDTGAMEFVMGDKPGLMTNVSPNLEHVLYATTSRSGVHAAIYDTASGTTTPLSFAPIPEKCEWSERDPTKIFCAVPQSYPQNTEYPDAWYKGQLHFTDMIWRIDIDAESSDRVQLIADLPDRTQQAIDAVNPFFGPREQYLYFTNKRDQTLWRMQVDAGPSS